MSELSRRGPFIVLLLTLWPGAGHAQMHHTHTAPKDSAAHHTRKPAPHAHGGMTHAMGGMDMGERFAAVGARL